MIISMTGFAKQQLQSEGSIITWEVKTVNSRFLDINFRLPETSRSLEPKLRSLIKKYLARGKLDITLRYQIADEQATQLQINQVAVNQLAAAIKEVESSVTLAPVDPLKLLRWPGVLEINEELTEEVSKAMLTSFEEALVKLVASREKEGAGLSAFIEEKLHAMEHLHQQATEIAPVAMQLQRERLQEKLADLQMKFDSDRLEQEMVLICQKSDVQEELDRLLVHIAAFRELLSKGGVVGRRLDFLTQEMNREANTLGSKSAHEVITQTSMELKVIIEQIKEQVQNIE
jgi:uncharacterized protein (TIGR00255 family)